MSRARAFVFSLCTGMLLLGTACGPQTPDPATPDKDKVPSPDGTSTAQACGAGKAECDGDATTSCETDTTSSAAHCGACGKACGAGESCVAGACSRGVSLSAEDATACAVLGGKVACWGDNQRKVISGASKAPVATPTWIPGIEKATAVRMGERFACAIDSGGKLQCIQEGKARELPLVTDVVDAAIQDDRIFLVRKNGELSGVSLGYSGKDMTPIEVPAMTGLAAVRAGSNHACVLHKSGEVTCWGDPEYMGAGVDTSKMDYTERAELGKKPAMVKDLKDAVQLSVSDTHSCAVRKTKQVVCWGSNWSGELGDGSQEQRNVPVTVQLLDDAQEVAAGYHHTCARRSTGKVVCWGDGHSGQLGAGTPGVRGMVEVKDLDDAVALTAGRELTCAARKSGGISCWGAASRGRLGNGTVSDYVSPKPVAGLAGVTQLGLGERISCSLDGKGQLQCWGLPGYSEENLTKRGNTPKVVSGVADIESLTVSRSTVCVTDKAKTAYCDYADGFLKGPKAMTALGKVKSVRAWGSFGTALLPSGQVVLFGRSWSKPEDVQKMNLSGMADAVSVAADSSVVCAVRKSGKIGCLSYSFRTFDKKDAIKPTSVVEVPGVTDAVSITGESGEMCFLKKNGDVGCFSSYRVPPTVDPKAAKPAAGATKEKPQPIEVKMLKEISGATKLAMGGGAHCALLKDGTAMCWGSNSEGQLAVGDYEYRWEPTVVPGLTDVTTIELGSGQGCAAKKSGEVVCWGRNASDEAGQAAASYAWGPVPVTLPR